MLATLATGCGLVLHSAPLARPHALVHRADAARMIDISSRTPGFAARARADARCAVSLSFTLSQPSQAEAEEMGIREWPQSSATSELIDECADGALRYVLEGTGTVCVENGGGDPVAVAPNSLVRVGDGGATLRWVPDDELLLLTPEYKGPNLLPVAAGIFVLFAALLAVAGGG